jgi:hypothetical protein
MGMGSLENGRSLAKVLDALLSGNRFSRSLSGPRIGFGSLATDGETGPVPHSAVTLDFTEATDVLRDLSTQRTFHRVVTFQQGSDPPDLIIVDVTGGSRRIDSQFLTNLSGHIQADSVEVSQGILNLFIVGDIDAHQTGHNQTPVRVP